MTLSITDSSGPQNSRITPESGTFGKNITLQSPLNVTMATYGNTLDNIADASTALVQGAQYSVNGNTVTLSSAYLACLPAGPKTLTFNFSAGAPQTYTITVIDTTPGPQNSRITPESGTFDKNITLQSPLNVTIDTYGNTLDNIADGSATLLQGSQYSVNGNTVTLNSTYLASLPIGPKTLTFNFSAGAPQSYTITVIDTTVNPVPNPPVLQSVVPASGQTVTTVVVDPARLEERLNTAGQNAVITIPITTASDVVVGELNGQMVSNLEKKQAILEIQTDAASYAIPAEQIDIDAISTRR
ncbi:X2-like carbohydrate binding domain-containing protein [Paenibacillus silviterrae]|uniref:X2-like carbohydrate binding domain-containing protein n=1 Tax=Paenibacillus silviterrae TaxID=3242194 RepID=UPI003559361A